MSAKLIVHKFEAGVNFKSLQITIDDNDNSSEPKFSKWVDARTQQKKKDTERSSRLVVKIVTNDNNNFNLDICAKEVKDFETYLYNSSVISYKDYEQQINPNGIYNVDRNTSNYALDKISSNGSENYNKLFNDYKINTDEHHSQYLTSQKNIFDTDKETALQKLYTNNYDNMIMNNQDNTLNPLECKLEKVKENNARIMENIHMLNRTLNYTKKKEILDIIFPKAMPSYSCNICGKCFVYETGLKRHFSMRHAMVEMQPRWQVVWTCIECFQVWPRQDLALKHSSQCCKSDNTDCIREIKTSSLLQCEFCEKVFTSIPRLLRHAKLHTTTNNYECNACEMVFASYKAAEVHWLICPWLKICYNFSLPKMLLCNACDRKFRNYEQLYNHRYKVSHFMMKTHCNQIDSKSIGILVYQCETCGEWFLSVPLLQAHKNQHHPRNDTMMQCRMERAEHENDQFEHLTENISMPYNDI